MNFLKEWIIETITAAILITAECIYVITSSITKPTESISYFSCPSDSQ